MHPLKLVSLLYNSLACLSLPLGVFSIALIYKTTAREQRPFGYYLINLQFWTLLYDLLAGFAVQPVFQPLEQCILSSGFTRNLPEDYAVDLVVVTMQFFVLCCAALLSLVAHRYGVHIFNTFSQIFIGKRSFFIAYFIHIFPLIITLCAFVFLDFRPVVREAFFNRFCSQSGRLWTISSFLVVILAVSLFFVLLMLFAAHQILHNLEKSRAIMRTRTYALNIKTTYSLFALIATFFLFKLLPLCVWVTASWIDQDMHVPITAAHLVTVLGSALQSFLILALVPPYPSMIVKIWRWARLRFPRNKLSYVQSSDSIKY